MGIHKVPSSTSAQTKHSCISMPRRLAYKSKQLSLLQPTYTKNTNPTTSTRVYHNLQTSHLKPSQIQPYLGAILNAHLGITYLNTARTHSILTLVLQFQPGHQVTVRTLMRLLGMMASCISIVPHACLHMIRCKNVSHVSGHGH